MSVEPEPSNLLAEAVFQIGGEDQLRDLRAQFPGEVDAEGARRLRAEWERHLADIHIRTGTLLKADTLCLLLGAGASRECGGPLIGSIPLELERRLIDQGVSRAVNPRVRSWVSCFYLAARGAGGRAPDTPSSRAEILQRRDALKAGAPPLAVNVEALLSRLYQWRAALPAGGGRIRIDGVPNVDLRSEIIDRCTRQVKSALVELCQLSAAGADEPGFRAYKDLLRKVLTRPLNLKRANIFTLNYDTLAEQAADAEGIILIDGFVGTDRRVFRPESYDYDLYFPAETTEGRVHRLDRVLHLYKLHGSVSWKAEEPRWDNPYGIRAHTGQKPDGALALIYPTPAKWGEALGMPYAELLRRFAQAAVRPQSVLFVIGYGFGDEHICAIIRQALAIPSFTLVIVDPHPESAFVATLQGQRDRRVWLFSGKTFGTFTGFVRYALADLREEGVLRKVIETHRALVGPTPAAEGEVPGA